MPKGTNTVAVAIICKTPAAGKSKTRLCPPLRPDECAAISACFIGDLGRTIAGLRHPATRPYAVYTPAGTEAELLRLLPAFSLTLQGEGDLGARMRHVCGTLLARHGRAVLIGADAPQLRAEDLLAACAALDAHAHALGPSEDGGFWLFATRVAVPDAAWSDTPWSQADTAVRFVDALGVDALGDATIATLRPLCDVDTVEDLAALAEALHALSAPTPTQAALATWLRGLPAPV